jgi:hypothetical protein
VSGAISSMKFAKFTDDSASVPVAGAEGVVGACRPQPESSSIAPSSAGSQGTLAAE